MFTTDIYVNPLDEHASTVTIPPGVKNWAIRVHFANVLDSTNSILSLAWTVHGRYKNNLEIASTSTGSASTGTALLNNNLQLGQSAYLTCSMVASVASSSVVTLGYVKTIQVVSANL